MRTINLFWLRYKHYPHAPSSLKVSFVCIMFDWNEHRKVHAVREDYRARFYGMRVSVAAYKYRCGANLILCNSKFKS